MPDFLADYMSGDYLAVRGRTWWIGGSTDRGASYAWESDEKTFLELAVMGWEPVSVRPDYRSGYLRIWRLRRAG